MFKTVFNSKFESNLFKKHCGFETISNEDNGHFEEVVENCNEKDEQDLYELAVFIKIDTIRNYGDYNMITQAGDVCRLCNIDEDCYVQFCGNFKALLNKYRRIDNEIAIQVLEEVKQSLK